MGLRIIARVLAGVAFTLVIFYITLFVQLPKESSKNNTIEANAKFGAYQQPIRVESSTEHTTGSEIYDEASFSNLLKNAYSFTKNEPNLQVTKKPGYNEKKCDGKVLNINTNFKHQEEKIDTITVEEFLREETTTFDSDIQNFSNEDQIIESVFGNKTKCYHDTQNKLYLTVINENKNFVTIDVADFIKMNGSKFIENNITLDKIRNYFYDKKTLCNDIQCHIKNENPRNNKQGSTVTFELNDLQSLEYIEFGQKYDGKDVFFVHTKKKKIGKINLEDCRRLDYQKLPKNVQESITNFINQISHILRFHNFKSVLIYNELIYLKVNDNLAYLFVKESSKGKNAFTDEINRINNITDNFFEQKNPKTKPRILQKFCNKDNYHLLNAETVALHSLFYPFCLGHIVNLFEDTDNGMTQNKAVDAFKVISKCLFYKNARFSTYQLKTIKSIEREYLVHGMNE
ncbi:hypothetical protein COBT_002127 [Conglomerata obtusa]